jgi:Cu+-exporting ATPase
MPLEPLQPTAESGPSPELREMTRRFWIGAVLPVLLLILDMGRDVRALTPNFIWWRPRAESNLKPPAHIGGSRSL